MPSYLARAVIFSSRLGACSSTQDALSKLLNATSKMVSEATAGKPVKELKAVPIATDWREAEKRIRWLINGRLPRDFLNTTKILTRKQTPGKC